MRLATLGTTLDRERVLKSLMLFEAISVTNSFASFFLAEWAPSSAFVAVSTCVSIASVLVATSISYCVSLLFMVECELLRYLLRVSSSMPFKTMNCFISSISCSYRGRCLFGAVN